MLIKPLKRVAVTHNEGVFLLEPSAGLATTFVQKLNEFPKLEGDDDKIDARYFSGFRTLICLEEDGRPFLPQLINHLNETSPDHWPITVLTTDPLRAVIDALDVSYLIRVIDYYLDALPVSTFEEFNHIIRTELWKDKEPAKNA